MNTPHHAHRFTYVQLENIERVHALRRDSPGASPDQNLQPLCGPGWGTLKTNKMVKICHFHQTTSSVVSTDDNETARVNEGRRVSSKSPSLARAGEEEGARKRTRLDSSITIYDYIFYGEK